jgi:L-ascorbate metabolism protein UlaG (beta-lactamase superfamily)
MKILKTVVKLIGILIVLAFAVLAYLLNTHEDLEPYQNHFVKSAPTKPAGVRVRFMGNTNLLFTDGTTTILIDGWYTRAGFIDLAFRQIEPDLDAISNGLERGRVGQVDAIIPVHSHYDHAMDTPEVAMRTGALVLGSNSTANIARGWGLAEDKIAVVRANRPYQFGDFSVTLIPTNHFEFANPRMREAALADTQITTPLIPPVKALEYKMGGAYSVYIQHPKGTALVQGSAGYIPGALDHIKADVVFLGVGGLPSQSKEYQQAYWQHVVSATKPKQLYPIHWDSLTDELEEQPVMQNLLLSKILGFESSASLDYAIEQAKQEAIEVGLLPMWVDIALFE